MTEELGEPLRDHLIGVAREGRTCTYAQAASNVGLDIRRGADMNMLTSMLRAIAKTEHEAGRPLLSVVCVMVGVKRPGQGFFDTAKTLGVIPPDQDNREFFTAELARVHSHWSRPKS